jgi:hypothetical protein
MCSFIQVHVGQHVAEQVHDEHKISLMMANRAKTFNLKGCIQLIDDIPQYHGTTHNRSWRMHCKGQMKLSPSLTHTHAGTHMHIHAGFCEHNNELYGSIRAGTLLINWANIQLFTQDSTAYRNKLLIIIFVVCIILLVALSRTITVNIKAGQYFKPKPTESNCDYLDKI